MGTGRFFVFYVLCGVGAALAQIISDPGSTIPMVGASGAIGGVMGAYALSFPRARIHLWFIITVISVPAILVLGYWFAIQLFSGVSTIDQRGGGVAFWAHIGGFVSGLVLVFAFRQPALVEARRAFLQGQAPRRQPNHRWP